MREVDFISGLVNAKSLVTKIGSGLFVLALILAFFAPGWGIMTMLVILGMVLLVNSLCIVMPGHAGYLIVLGHMANKSIQSGLRIVWPFISSVTEVDIRMKTHEDRNTMKNKDRRDVTLTYVLTWYLQADAVHTLHATIGENDYVQKALCPQLDACMTNIIASKTYDEINAGLENLSQEVMKAFSYETTLFRDVKLNIIDVKFDKDYEDAIAEAAKTEMQRHIVEEKAEQLRITATAKADALKIEAEAEAEALRKKGASENEVKERLGEILRTHPEILKETLARNFPKVYGGGNMMINMDDILGE